MIKSMTGYGRAESVLDNKKLVAEIKSLNHRYMEIYVRLSAALFPLELEVKKKIGDRFSRGRVEVNIRMDAEQGAGLEVPLELNIPLVRQYFALYGKIKQEFKLKDEITLEMLAGIKDAIVPCEEAMDLENIWKRLEAVLDEAIDSLVEMRTNEGESLCRDLIARVDILAGCMGLIASRAPQVVQEYQKRLTERVKELAGGVFIDEARMAQEVAIMAERSDITEEIVRFGSHIDQLRDMLKSDEAVGRKLDFLIQEMNREVNTIGSKTGDVEISRHVVEMKSELSKLREQVQNIE